MHGLLPEGPVVARRPRAVAIASSIAGVTLVTGAIYLLREAVPVLSLGVLYLFAVLPVAAVWGRMYSVFVAVASMLAFNFFFLPPVHTFRLADPENWFVLAVYLVVGIVVSDLAARARRRARDAEQREREETLLAELSIALLQGEQLTAELDRIGLAAAQVLWAERGRVELGPGRRASGELALELRAVARRVGTLFVPENAHPDPAICRRFLPALASLLAIAIDREELEREALAAERLRLSDSVKTAILRAVSHDLRSPLTAIRVAVDSLTSSSVTLTAEDRSDQLETVRAESRRLERLVGNLLDLSRLQAGAAAPRRELVSVDELISQALSQLGGDEARVSVTLPAELPLLEVDPIQIERSLVNMLENALRFSPPETQVALMVTAPPGEAVVEISDQGPGIPQRDLERVFEPFEQSARGDERAGSGLGLAIARGFAEANGGRIWAESRPGEGTSIALSVPRVPTPVEAMR
jgi:two-component system, OmpR family, sensor histidine kinase KdpD